MLRKLGGRLVRGLSNPCRFSCCQLFRLVPVRLTHKTSRRNGLFRRGSRRGGFPLSQTPCNGQNRLLKHAFSPAGDNKQRNVLLLFCPCFHGGKLSNACKCAEYFARRFRFACYSAFASKVLPVPGAAHTFKITAKVFYRLGLYIYLAPRRKIYQTLMYLPFGFITTGDICKIVLNLILW